MGPSGLYATPFLTVLFLRVSSICKAIESCLSSHVSLLESGLTQLEEEFRILMWKFKKFSDRQVESFTYFVLSELLDVVVKVTGPSTVFGRVESHRCQRSFHVRRWIATLQVSLLGVVEDAIRLVVGVSKQIDCFQIGESFVLENDLCNQRLRPSDVQAECGIAYVIIVRF